MELLALFHEQPKGAAPPKTADTELLARIDEGSGQHAFHLVATAEVKGSTGPLNVRRETHLRHHLPGTGSKEPNPESTKVKKRCFLKRGLR